MHNRRRELRCDRGDPITALCDQLAALEARVRALEVSRRPRLDLDAQLLAAVAYAVRGRAFTAAEVVKHAHADDDLRAALVRLCHFAEFAQESSSDLN